MSELKIAILEYVSNRRHVSFIELMKQFPSERGTWRLSLEYDSLVVWDGMSEALYNSIRELLEERRLNLHAATEFTYLADGGGLKLPVMKEIRDYKNPHWVPMTLDTSIPA